MNTLKGVVKPPRFVRDEISQNVFVEEVKEMIEKLNHHDRKKNLFDIVVYVMNLAEL